MSVECHVCMENVPCNKVVTCVNGHSCCQKHHLERIRAIYQEGRNAYTEGGTGQSCFMCRVPIGDNHFSHVFFKNLHIIQAIEIPKMMGVTSKIDYDFVNHVIAMSNKALNS